MSAISIREYVDDDKENVINVILPIQQQEFGIAITRDDQPDLANIPSFYQRGLGNFWVALDESEIIGTIALIDIGNHQAALRKMFVKKTHRGNAFGVAARLLAALLDWVEYHGIVSVYLGTTSKFLAAHRFYEKNGFARISQDMLPDTFPIMQVDTVFYRLSR